MLVIFIGGGGLPIFVNVGPEFPHRRRISIHRRLTRRVLKLFLKISPIIYDITLVTTFRELGLAVENCLFLQAFSFGPVTPACTKGGKEEVI